MTDRPKLSLPDDLQRVADTLFQDSRLGTSTSLPAEFVEWFSPYGPGWDIGQTGWEEAGEPGVIVWPPQHANFNDTEAAYAFGIKPEKVTDTIRLAAARKALDPEWLDHEFLSVFPVRIQSSAGDAGYLCLIIEIQGQGGPVITDELVLSEWKKVI